MVSIIKNQLLKHLSRYTKNLSSDKINLSTFRGEGDLSNLQLDENVLTELLELPSWLRLTSAWCNHVSFRITWTKLKSVPITLILDEVNIAVETCEIARSGAGGASALQGLAVPQGKYSFIHKVVDGITVIVNTVNVKFSSPAFTASVQMSRIRVESKTPKWLSGDLRVTRLKDAQRGIILIFKELSWQTVRIEASSTQDTTLTPLRLLTNQARCRITMKKKLSDCTLLASRLVLILDDLLWVLTDSQLKAALHFVDSLFDLIKTSTHETQKTKAQKKLETLPEYQAQIAQQNRQTHQMALTTTQKMFNAFDVHETSYHFFSQRIDLHLCDDEGGGRSCYPELSDGGALQISVQAFQTDYYPYHLAKSDRSHWAKYKEATVPPALWLEQSLTIFREAVLSLGQPNRTPSHAPLERKSPMSPHQPLSPSQLMQQNPGQTSNSGQSTPGGSNSSSSIASDRNLLANMAKLMSACVVLRIEDFTLYRVTTSGKKQMPKEFIAGDKDRYSFPADMPTIHAEFTYFYYPGDFIFPLPPSKVYVYANPIQINFDLSSVLWLNSFAMNLHESLLRTNVISNQQTDQDFTVNSSKSEPNLMYMDVKLEAIMPRIIIECPVDVSSQRDRPKIMQIQISRFTITNIREMGSSRADLAQALHSLQEGSLVFGCGFPSASGDMCIVTDRILSHVAASDVPPLLQECLTNQTLSRYAMWSEPRDVWCLKLDPVWIDFMGAKSLGQNKTIPFIDAVPITLWVHGKSDNVDMLHLEETYIAKKDSQEKINRDFSSYSVNESSVKSRDPFQHSVDQGQEKSRQSSENTADLHAIAHVSNLVSIQIDHYQFLFLLRLAEVMTELTTFLSLDSKRILQQVDPNKSIIFGCVIPQVEVTLVMPSQTPGKESSGGDAESVLLDSASLGDDLHMNSAAALWQTPTSLDQLKNTNLGSIEMPSPITNEPPLPSNPNAHGYNVQIQSSPTIVSDSSTIRKDTQAISVSSKNGKSRSAQIDGSFSKDLNSGLLSMKKGFSSFMTSIDSALKVTQQGTSDDASDTFSVYSDVSSDSENFAIVMNDDKTADCMDVMFRLNPFTNDSNIKVSPVEVASEVCEEPSAKTNMSSPSEPSEGSSWRRRDLVSMATFRLTTVEVIKENKGYSSSIRLQVSAISCDECGAIPWDELQTDSTDQLTKMKFGARCRAWNIAPYNPEALPCVQLRLEENLNPPDYTIPITDKNTIKSWFTHHAEIRVKDLNLDLSMSTVIGLGDLCEDEIITKPLPLNIFLENVSLNLIEDRPPVNITSPGPVPINLQIGKMKIVRDDSGIIHLEPDEKEHNRKSEERGRDRDRELLALQLVMQQLKLDNENYKKQLISVRENSESNRLKAKQENELLRTYLKAAQDDISTLLSEKQTLIETIKTLQQQVNAADVIRKNDGNR